MKTFKTYSSVADFAATLNGETINSYCKKSKEGIEYFSKARLLSFAGVSSVDEAKELLVGGDATAAAKIRAAGEILKPREGHSPIMRPAVAGCIPNIPNYLRGVPTQMFQIKNNSRQRPIVDLYVDTTIYDGIDTRKLAEKSAIIANAIAATELAGYRVALWTLAAIKSIKDDYACCAVNLKEADSPLNLLNIAFPLLNKAYSRALCTTWIEKNVKYSMKYRTAVYGCVMRVQEIKDAFNIEGIFLSMSTAVNEDYSQERIEKEINDYLSNRP
jgi:hypothetical protein